MIFWCYEYILNVWLHSALTVQGERNNEWICFFMQRLLAFHIILPRQGADRGAKLKLSHNNDLDIHAIFFRSSTFVSKIKVLSYWRSWKSWTSSSSSGSLTWSPGSKKLNRLVEIFQSVKFVKFGGNNKLAHLVEFIKLSNSGQVFFGRKVYNKQGSAMNIFLFNFLVIFYLKFIEFLWVSYPWSLI